MELTQIAHCLGISQYPSALNELYTRGDLNDPYDPALLEEMQAQYNILGPYYDITRQAMLTLPQDTDRYAWARVAATYLSTAPVELATRVPMPATDGTPLGDLLPMLILLPQIRQAAKEYRRMGFSGEALDQVMQVYGRTLLLLERKYGRPLVDQLYYWWLGLYARVSIFHCSDFQFELRKLPKDAMFLQCISSGELLPLMLTGTYHRSGQLLGSGGCTDEANSFTAAVRETEDAWYGLTATEGIVSPREVCFPKSQWRCVLRPEDTVLSMHIARGADLSPTAVDKALDEAAEIGRRCFPQWNTNTILCHSWLLDPMPARILGAESNIARFAARFSRYPLLSGGRNGFDYVFPPGIPDAELPENTRLQRGLKAHYLSGGRLYGCSGVLITKERNIL